MRVFSYSYVYFVAHKLSACQTRLSGSVISIPTVRMYVCVQNRDPGKGQEAMEG